MPLIPHLYRSSYFARAINVGGYAASHLNPPYSKKHLLLQSGLQQEGKERLFTCQSHQIQYLGLKESLPRQPACDHATSHLKLPSAQNLPHEFLNDKAY